MATSADRVVYLITPLTPGAGAPPTKIPSTGRLKSIYEATKIPVIRFDCKLLGHKEALWSGGGTRYVVQSGLTFVLRVSQLTVSHFEQSIRTGVCVFGALEIQSVEEIAGTARHSHTLALRVAVHCTREV